FVIPFLEFALVGLDLATCRFPIAQDVIDPLLLVGCHSRGPFGLLRHRRKNGLRDLTPSTTGGLNNGLHVAGGARWISICRWQLDLRARGDDLGLNSLRLCQRHGWTDDNGDER